MSIVLALLLGLVIGYILGLWFVTKHQTELLLDSFKNMTEEDVLKWFRKQFSK